MAPANSASMIGPAIPVNVGVADGTKPRGDVAAASNDQAPAAVTSQSPVSHPNPSSVQGAPPHGPEEGKHQEGHGKVGVAFLPLVVRRLSSSVTTASASSIDSKAEEDAFHRMLDETVSIEFSGIQMPDGGVIGAKTKVTPAWDGPPPPQPVPQAIYVIGAPGSQAVISPEVSLHGSEPLSKKGSILKKNSSYCNLAEAETPKKFKQLTFADEYGMALQEVHFSANLQYASRGHSLACCIIS